MKGIDIFCSSPASTSICVSIQDQRSIGRHGGVGGGSRAIDRYNPHLIDRSRRIRTTPQLITTTSSTSVTNSSQKPPQPPPTKPKHNHDQHHHQHQNIKRKKKKNTSASSSSSTAAPAANKPTNYDDDEHLMITPGSSSRYLLSDTAYLDVISELEPQVDHFSSSSSSALVNLDSATTTRSIINTVESPVASNAVAALKDVPSSSSTITTPTSPVPSTSNSSSSSGSSRCLDQVVELKVSLHCRGCERKMKKHISRMQGVRTFSIDFVTKKVTVIGDVSPLSVLDSISRVKNAQFWSSSVTPSGGLMSCR